jgi:hypothetical protein
MLRPAGDCTAYFDLASLEPADEPPPAAEPTATSTATPTATRSAGAANTATPRPAAARAAGVATPTPAGQELLASGPTSLRISEILSDPEQSGRDTPFEWVELVNVGSEPVDLLGCELGDAAELDALPTALVQPGGYVLVAGNQATLPVDVLTVHVDDGDIGNGLNNDGDRVRLLAPDGSLVDEVSFGSNVSVFDPAPAAPGAGKTLGIRDVLADPGGESWAITLRPCPGEPNVFAVDATPAAGKSAAPAGPVVAADARADLVTTADDSGRSPLPWLILAGVVGAGGFATAGRAVPRALEYWRRRRGR